MLKSIKKLIAAVSAAAMVAAVIPAYAAVDLPAEIPSANVDLLVNTEYTATPARIVRFSDESGVGNKVIEQKITIDSGVTSATIAMGKYKSSTQLDKENGTLNIDWSESSQSYSLRWQTSSTAFSPIGASLSPDTEYRFVYNLPNVGTTNSAGTLDIYQEHTPLISGYAISTRSMNNTDRVYDAMRVFVAGTGTMSLGIELIADVPNKMEVTLAGNELNETANNILYSYTQSNTHAIVGTALNGTQIMADYGINLALENAPEGVTLSNGNLVIADSISDNATEQEQTYNFNITAIVKNSEDVAYDDTKVTFPVILTVPLPDPQEIVDAIANNLEIETTGANLGKITKSGDTYYPTDDFTILTSSGVATISWATSELDSLGKVSQITLNGNNVVVTPDMTDSGYITLTATVSYNGKTAAKDFVLDLSTYRTNITNSISTVMADKMVAAADDTAERYVAKAAYDSFTSSNALSYDLVLPTTVSGNSNLSQTWSVSDADAAVLAISDNTAKIVVQDMAAHTINLTRKIEYKKNGKVIDADTETVPVVVQFDVDDVAAKADGWVADYMTANPDANATTVEKTVKDTFLRAYQLRLDAACESNFSYMPTSNSNISSGVSGLKMKSEDTMFGSIIDWSTNSSYATVSPASKTIAVSTGSFSGTQNIKVIATLSVAGYSKTDEKQYSYVIVGTKSTSGSSSSGTSSNQGSTIIRSTPTPVPTPVATKAPYDEAFDDVDEVASWAGDSIKTMYDKGIILGKGDKKFAPQDNVTRGEFTKMLVGTFGLSDMPETYHSFTDVPAGNWCFSYVEIANAAGIVNGYEDGSFGLNDNITRQDMAVMVARAAKAANVTITSIHDSVSFGDEASIADYAKESVDTLAKAGIINGIDGNFEPAANATRAQAAKILATFIN